MLLTCAFSEDLDGLETRAMTPILLGIESVVGLLVVAHTGNMETRSGQGKPGRKSISSILQLVAKNLIRSKPAAWRCRLENTS